DRAAMKAGNWSGIVGVNSQDFAMVESMGPIIPRHKEHLGATDIAVIAMRRRLLQAVKAFQAGEDPPGTQASIRYDQIVSEEKFVPNDMPWQAVGPELDGAGVLSYKSLLTHMNSEPAMSEHEVDSS